MFWDSHNSLSIRLLGVFTQQKMTANSSNREAKVWAGWAGVAGGVAGGEKGGFWTQVSFSIPEPSFVFLMRQPFYYQGNDLSTISGNRIQKPPVF